MTIQQTKGQVTSGLILPGMPHPMLVPDANPGYGRLRSAYEKARAEIAAADADLIIVYSAKWLSVIGHQIQAHPEPSWVHVDPEWHDLGSMPYKFRMDEDFAEAYQQAATARGLHARTVAYDGFPIDTGTVVALQLLNPDNRLPACVVSCNMYADRGETLVLGKAARDALAAQGKRAIAIAITALSNRMHTDRIDFSEDRIASPKDDEWNHKLLELLRRGRLEDVSHLARQFSREAHSEQKLKAIWWLSAFMGQHNGYQGEVLAYEPVYGTGAAVVTLKPADDVNDDQEFDEDDVDVFHGERNVLSGTQGNPARGPRPNAEKLATPSGHTRANRRSADGQSPESPASHTLGDAQGAKGFPGPAGQTTKGGASRVHAVNAPKPVGAYPHARRVGNLLFLSGVGPRHPDDGSVPGGPVRDAQGDRLPYDITAQCRQTIANVQAILKESGLELDHVVDVTAFLIDMEKDFEAFNRVYAEAFGEIGASRTTVEVQALPTPIAVEFKVVAAIT
jgi:2-aminophenol/2-amino-5-chlorophenol 1,6-dioxygenase alpha subunit